MSSRVSAVLGSDELCGEAVRSGGEAGIRCHEVFYAGEPLEEHAHRDAFFALALDGIYRQSAAGRVFECGPRSVVFNPAGEPHAVSFPRAIVRCFVLEFAPEEMQRRYDSMPAGSLLHADGGPLAALLSTAYREFRHADSCSSLAIQGIALQLIAAVGRSERNGEDHGRPPWLDRVSELLRESYRQRLTIEQIAAEVGVAPARLSAEFRRVHGRSIAEEQRRLRVEYSCRRMSDRHLSLADVAIEAGFSDQPHFSRTFKEVTGMSPAQYRSEVIS